MHKFLLVLVFGLLSIAAFAQPANDNCGGAVTLTVGTTCTNTSGTNVGATSSAGIPAPGCANYLGGDVWYKAVVNANGKLTVSTSNGSSPTISDPGMAIYTGACGSLSLYECDDDDGSASHASISINNPCLAGQTVFIRIWEYGNNVFGNFNICATAPAVTAACPSNDYFTTATSIFVNTPLTGTTVCATPSDEDPTAAMVCGTSIENTVWYKFTALTTGLFTVNTTGYSCSFKSGIQIGVLTGTCDSYTLVNCQEGYPPGSFTFNGTAGTTYYLPVDGFAGAECNFTITINSCNATNDDCSTADVVPGLTGVNTQVCMVDECNIGAADNTGDISASDCGDASGATVWYTITTDATDRLLDINISNSDFTPHIQVWTNCSTYLTSRCDVGAAGAASIYAMPVTGSTTYKISVSPAGGVGTGFFDFCVKSYPNPCVTLSDNCSAPSAFPALTSNVQSCKNTECNLGAASSIGGTNSCGTIQGGVVWYSLTTTATGTLLDVDVTSTDISDPMIQVWSNCTTMITNTCATGTSGTASLTIGTSSSTNYLISVTSASGNFVGNFGICVRSYLNTDACNTSDTIKIISATPPADGNGNYLPGTTVRFCYEVNKFKHTSQNFIHGVVPSFGSGWDLTTLTPTTTPPPSATNEICSQWDFFPANTVDYKVAGGKYPAGTLLGAGWFFQSENSGGGPWTCLNIGTLDPNNSWGDGCTDTIVGGGVYNAGTCGTAGGTWLGAGNCYFGCYTDPINGYNYDWNFCWDITTKTSYDCVSPESFTVSAETFADGETGGWTNLGCTADLPHYKNVPAPSPAPIIIIVDSLFGATCNGFSDGRIYARSSGGYGTRRFQVDGGVLQASGTFTGLSTGAHTLTVEDGIGCTQDFNFNITNPAKPAGPVPDYNDPLCVGSNLNLTSTAGFTNYSWTGPGAYTSSSQNPTRTAVTAAQAGFYYITAQSGGCATLTDSVNVILNGKPTAAITSNDSTVCSGTTITLNGNPTGGSGTYDIHTWTGNTDSLSSTSIVNPSFTNRTPGSYTLTYTVTDDKGCVGTDNITLTIFSKPSASISPDPANVCEGVNLTMNGTPSGGSGVYSTHAWTGAGATSLSNAAIVNPVFNNSTNGSYALVYTVTDNNGCTGTDNISVTVRDNPVAAISPDPAAVCEGLNLNMNGTPTGGSGTYSTHAWTGAGSTSLSNTAIVNPVFNNGTNGSYALVYTVTDNNGCVGTDNITVTVRDNPVATISPDPASVCEGVNLNMNGTPTGGSGTYSTHAWTGAGATSLSNTAIVNPVFNNGTNGSYALVYTVTDNNGCVGSDNITVTVRDNPVAAISPDPANVCEGVNLNMNGTPSGGSGVFSTHAWTGAGATSLSSTAIVNPVFNNATNGSYVLNYTVTDNTGCTGTDNITVNVNDNPVAAISPDPANVCEGINLNMNGTPSGGSGIYSIHAWTGAGATSLSNTAIVNPVFNNATNGSYALTYTVTDNNGCTGTDNLSVTVRDNPAAAISPDPATVCEGVNLNMNGTPTGGSGTYSTHAWTGAGATSLSNSAIVNPVFNNATNGTYALTYTVTDNNGCTGSDNITVTVNDKPAAAISPDPATVCEGVNLNMNGTPSGGSGVYSTHAWTGAGSASLSNTAIVNPVFNNGTNGTYALTYTVTDNNGCTGTDNITVTVNDNPAAAISPDPAGVCEGVNLSMNGTPSGGSGTYSTHSWTGAGSTSLSNTAIVNPVFNNATSGTYALTYTVSDNNGCIGTDNLSVTVNANPAAAISPDPANVCESVNLNLNGTPSGGSGTYSTHLWTGTGATSLSSTAIVNPVFNNATAGTYNLTYTVTDNNGCTATDNITITVYDRPAAAISPDPATVCEGINLNLNGTPSGGSGIFSTHLWAGAGATSLSNTGIVNPVFNNGTNGTYALTYTVTDNNGCTATDNITITVNDNPVAAISPDPAAVCEGVNLNMNGTPAGGSGTYSTHSWTGAGSTSLSNNAIVAPVFNNATNGTYLLTYTVTDNNGCIGTDNVTVTVNDRPTAAISPDPATVCEGVNLNMNGTPAGGSGTYSVHAWTGAGSSSLSNTAIVNPIFNNGTSGSYALTYTVTDNNGCTGTDNITVTVNDNPAPSISPDPAAVCEGVNLNMNGNPTGGSGTFSSHVWSGAGSGSLSNTTIVNPVFNNAASGTYALTYTVTDNTGCSGFDNITVTVNDNPSVGITPQPAITCAGSNMILDGNPSGGTTPYTMLWTGSTGPLSATNDSLATFNSATSGNFNLTFTTTDVNGCVAQDTIIVVNKTLPTGTDQNPSTCEDVPLSGTAAGVDLTILNSSITGGFPYTVAWFNDAGLTVSVPDPTNVTVSNGQIFYARVTNNGCSDVAVVTYSVTSTFTANDQFPVECEDSSGTGEVYNYDLTTINGSIAGTAITWYVDAALSTPVGNPTDTTITNGDIFYAEAVAGICRDTATISFTINAKPLGVDQSESLCSDVAGGSTVIVDLTSYDASIGAGGPTTVSWYSDPTLTTPVGTPSAASVSSGNIRYGLLDNGNCVDTAAITFTVDPTPVATDITPSRCEDTFGSGTAASVDLTALDASINGGTANPVSWFSDASLSTPVGTPSSETVTDGEIFYAYVTQAACFDTAVVTYNIDSLPVANNIIKTVCENSSGSGIATVDLTILDDSVNGVTPNIVSWFTDAGLTSPVSNPVAHDVSNGTIVYASIDDGTCQNDATVTYTVTGSFTANNLSPAVCEDTTGTLIAYNVDLTGLNVSVAPFGITWYEDAALSTLVPAPGNVTVVNGTDFYALAVDGTCRDTAQIVYSVNSRPAVINLSPDLCETTEGTFVSTGVNLTAYNSAINAGGGLTFTWYSDPALAVPVADPANENVSDNADYFVYVENANCGDTSVVTFNVDSIPTANDLSKTYCENSLGSGISTVDLTALDDSVNGVTSNVVSWFTDAGLTTPVGTPGAHNVSNGTIVYASVTDGTCSNSGSITFTITGSFSANNLTPSVCEDSTGTLNAYNINLTALEGSIGFAPITWFEDAALATPVGTPANVQVTNGTDFYALSVSGNCRDTSSVIYTVNSRPVVSNITPDICETSEGSLLANAVNLTSFNASINGTAGSFAWFSDPALSIPVGNDASEDVSDNETFYVLVDNGNCTDTATAIFNIDPLPVATDLARTECEDSISSGTTIVNLTALDGLINGGTANAVTWFSDAGLTVSIVAPAAYSVSNGTIVYASVTNGTCQNSASVTYTVTSFIVANDLTREVCEDVPGSLTAAGIDLTALDASVSSGTINWYSDASLATPVGSPSSVTVTNGLIFYAHSVSGSCQDTGSVTYTVNAKPVVSFTLPDSICSGSPSFVMNTGLPSGGTYSGGAVTDSSFVPDSGSVGFNSVTYTYSNGTCANTAIDSIRIDSIPVVTLTLAFDSICESSSAIGLTGGLPNSPNGTYSGPGVALNNFDPSAATLGYNSIGYVFTDLNGCAGNAIDSIYVNAVDAYTITYSSGTYCITGAVDPVPVITGSPSGGFLSAPPGLVFVNAVTGEIDLSASDTGTYTLTYIHDVGPGLCGADTGFTLKITADPVFTAFSYPSLTVCQEPDTISPVMVAGSSKGVFSATPAGLNIINPATGDIDLGASLPGTYTVFNFISGASGCAASKDSVTLVVDSSAVVFAGIDDTICEGETLTLNAILSGAGTSVTWSTSGNGSFSDSTSLTPVYTHGSIDLSNGFVNLIVTTDDPAGTCAGDADTLVLTIQPEPVVAITLPDSICEGSATFSINTGTPNIPMGVYSGTGVTDTLFDPSAGVSGKNFITYTYTNNACSVSITDSIWIESTPVVSLSLLVDSACMGMTPFALSGGSPTNGIFSGPGVSANNFDPGLAGLGSKVITYLFTNSVGCKDSATDVMEVLPQDTFTVSYNDSMYCQTGTNPVPLISGGTTGLFTSTPGLVFVNAGTGEINLSASTIGSYSITFTSNNPGGCPKDTVLLVEITSDTVDAIFGYVSPVCQSTGLISPVLSDPSTSGKFTAVPVGLSIDSATGIINAIMSSPGTYTVTYTVVPAGSCASATHDTTITIILAALVDAGIDGSVCEGDTIDLAATLSGAATSMAWSAPSGSGSFSSTTNPVSNYIPSLTDIGNGSVMIRAITNDPAGVCPSDTDEVNININLKPVVGITLLDNICEGESSFTIISGTPSGGIYSGGAITGSVFNPAAGFPGYNLVTYTYSDGNCSNSIRDSIRIDTLPIVTLVLPVDSICSDGLPFTLSGGNPTIPSGVYSGPGISGNVFDPAGLPIGFNKINYNYQDENGCVSSAVDSILVNPQEFFTIGYNSGTYCISGLVNPVPTISGGATGIFTSAPGGLVFANDSTGEINLSLCDTGIYTITYNSDGFCSNDTSFAIEITKDPVEPYFSYTSPVCQGTGILAPIMVPGSSKGVFSSSSAGVIFDSISGNIYLDFSLAGTYVLTNTIPPQSGCSQASDTALIVIDSSATVSAGSDTIICAGETLMVSGGFGGAAKSIVWTSSGDGSFADPSNVSTIYSPGTNDIAVGNVNLIIASDNPSGSCGSGVDTLLLTIQPLPLAPKAGNVTICEGSDAILVAILPGGLYSWFADSNLTVVLATGDSLVTPVLFADTSYFVQTTIGNCVSPASEVEVTVDPYETASFSYNLGAYCQSATDTVANITGSSGGVFTASPAGLVFSNNVSGEIDFSASAIGSYTIKYVTNGQCKDSSTMAIEIVTSPVIADFTYNGPYCIGDTIAAIADTSVTKGKYGTFTSSPAGLVFKNITTGEIDLDSSLANTYTVINTISGSSGCGAASDTQMVVLNPGLFVSVSGDTAICSGSTIQVSSAVTGTGTGGFWDSEGSGAFSDSVSLTPVYTYSPGDSAAGSVKLWYVISGDCYIASDTLIITIQPEPSAGAGNPDTICEGDSIYLTGVIGGSATMGLWSTASGDGALNPMLPVSATYLPGAGDIANGKVMFYFITDDPAGPCSNAIDSVEIFINKRPDVDAGFDQLICEGNPVNLSGDSSLTASVKWTTNGSGTFNNDAILTPVYTPSIGDAILQNIEIYLSSEDPAGSCSAEIDTMELTINTSAKVDGGVNYSICAGNNINLSATISGTATTMSWSVPGVGVLPTTGPLTATYVPASSDISNGFVIAIATTDNPPGICEEGIDTLLITIKPQAIISISANDISICSGEIVDLSANANSTVNGFAWSTLGAGNFDNNSVANPVFTPSATGNAIVPVLLTGSDTSGVCPSVTDSIMLKINSNPVAGNGVVDSTTCGQSNGGIKNIVINSGTGPFTYNWTNVSGASVGNGSNLQNVPSGVYRLYITDANGCADSTETITVGNKNVIALSFTTSATAGGSPLNVVFTNTSTGADTYNWDFGDFHYSAETSPAHNYTVTGNYTVTLIGSNSMGCKDTIYFEPIVVQDSLIIPSVISPNGDGTNDIFTITGSKLKNVNANIMNRWGEAIYSWNSLRGGWDGRTYSGVLVPEGTYYYLIELTFRDGKKLQKAGFITVVLD